MIHRFLIYDRKFNCRIDRRYPLSQFSYYNNQQLQHQQSKQRSKNNLLENKKVPNLNLVDENSDISLNSCAESGFSGVKLWNVVTIDSSDESEIEENNLNEEMKGLRLSGGANSVNFNTSSVNVNPNGREIVEHSQQLILGMTHSLKNMLTKLAPKVPKPATPNEPSHISIEGHSFSMKTSKYRLFYFESFTGWKLVMLTDCSSTQNHHQQHHPHNQQITLSNGISVSPDTALKVFYTQILQKYVLTYPLGQIYATGEGPVDNDFLKRPGFLIKLDEFVHGIDKLF